MGTEGRVIDSHWIDVVSFYDDLVQTHHWAAADPLRKFVHQLSADAKYSVLYSSHSHASLIVGTSPSWPEPTDSACLIISPQIRDYKYELIDFASNKPRRMEYNQVHPDHLYEATHHLLDYLIQSMLKEVKANP